MVAISILSPMPSLLLQIEPSYSVLRRNLRAPHSLTFAKDSSSVAPAYFPVVRTQAINPLTCICLPLAIIKPHLLYAIMLAASDNLLLRGAHNGRQVTALRGRTIHFIKEALHDKKRAMEDATFAAVVHLAFTEVSM